MGILESSLARRARRSPLLRPPAVWAYRTLDRLTPAPPGPRVLGNSMPKSGTHLLAALLDQMDGMRFSGRLAVYDAADTLQPERRLGELDRCLRTLRDSHYAGAHLMYDPRIEARVAESNASLVTILRDPRAIVLSGAHYVLDARHLQGRAAALEVFPDLDSILHALVRGHGGPRDPLYFPEIGERFRRYAAWLDADTGITVRFEDLVGAEGGGRTDRQLDEVARILKHIGYDGPQSPADLAAAVFSPDSVTFRSGKVDSWRQELPTHLADEIAMRCSKTMERLGYHD